MMWQKFLGVTLLFVATSAWAGNDILVRDVWLRESVPGQDTASLQLNLTATRPATLLAVTTPVAGAVQIQRVLPTPGRVNVRVLRSLPLPRDRTVSFGQRGLSLMLVGLKAQLYAGEQIPVTLSVRLAGGKVSKLEVPAEVRPLDLSYRHYEQGEVHDH